MLIFGVLSFTIIQIFLFSEAFVTYSNTCLRLFVVILQDLHCLQRSYHNVDQWVYYTLPSHQFPHLVELLLEFTLVQAEEEAEEDGEFTKYSLNPLSSIKL